MNFKPLPNKFEYLNWQEIEIIAKDKRSTLIWPFGAVEQHGPHLPLATDSIFVDEIICEVLKLIPNETPIKKIPTQYFGFSPEHKGFDGTISLSSTLLISMIKEVGVQIADMGFKRLIMLNAHGGQISLLNTAARELRRQSEISDQGIAAQAASAGAFGGSRQAILEAENQRNLQQGLGDLYARAQADAYQTALSASQQDRQNQLRSALGMSTVAGARQASGTADINQLMGLGGLERQMDQQALDIGYSNFLQERDYPKQQLGFYSDILRGVPTGETRQYTGPPVQQPSLFSQALGLGIQGLGVAANLGFQPFA